MQCCRLRRVVIKASSDRLWCPQTSTWFAVAAHTRSLWWASALLKASSRTHPYKLQHSDLAMYMGFFAQHGSGTALEKQTELLVSVVSQRPDAMFCMRHTSRSTCVPAEI